MSFVVVVFDMFTDNELGRFAGKDKESAWNAAWEEFGWNDSDWCGDVRFEERQEK